jgi:demethylmenaquinone methyltransferase/2-methoxy-6-polyprenyl-1,4-benzoquinol methylase
MKLLESAPSRYDRGIRILTLGGLDEAYDRLTAHIRRGHRVLDIGCGTGALTLRAAQKGAKLKGIDINSQMLEIAKKRAIEANLAENTEFCEMGVAELGGEESNIYDVVMSGLCFSELTEAEISYTLKEARRILKPGGILLIADEVKPKSLWMKIVNWFIRIPLLMITYIITQTTTHAIDGLPEKIMEAGFRIETFNVSKLQSFIELVGRNPYERPK